VCVCNLSYPACSVHVPYNFVICGLSGSIIFYTLFQKWQKFLKKFLNVKCVLFSLHVLSGKLLILRRIQWSTIIHVHGLHVNYLLFICDLNESWIFLTDFQKYSNMKFYENLFSKSQLVPCRHTDRHNKANGRFVQFCKINVYFQEHNLNGLQHWRKLLWSV
jgi:hypothetical protein